MNSAPVSVVIPAYRAARTIRRALDSVLAQTLAPAEVIVVDDGSPDADELASVVGSYGPLVTLIRQPNGGASSARNAGIERATQEWVALLDADDYWEADKLERQMRVAAEHEGLGVIGCAWFVEEPGQARVPAPERLRRFSGRRLAAGRPDAFDIALVMGTGSLLIRRSALEHERFDTSLESAEDRDLWIRLALGHDLFLLPELLMTFVIEPGSLSRSSVDRDCSSMLTVVRRYASILGARGLRRQEAVVYRRWAAGHLSRGRADLAWPYASRRLRLEPFSAEAWAIAVTCLLGGRSGRRAPAADAARETRS